MTWHLSSQSHAITWIKFDEDAWGTDAHHSYTCPLLLSATGQNQWLDQWCDFYNFSKTGPDIAHHDVTWELPWPGSLTCIHTPCVPPPPTNACSSQNGRTVKQSHCEKVYNYSAFELSIIEISTGCYLKAKYDLTKSCTRNGLTQYMQKQAWETHLVEE